jgi:RNA polymerase sigma-70 factor (ECF subfamily)
VFDASLEAQAARQQEGQAAEIAEVLGKLEPEARIAILLVDMEGHSYTEAAEIIGISESALRSRLHRARQAFIGEYEKK